MKKILSVLLVLAMALTAVAYAETAAINPVETVLTDEWFARELENLQHTVVDSGAFERDRARWPEGNHEGDYASLSAYTQKRLAWLDTFMSDIEAGLKNWE